MELLTVQSHAALSYRKWALHYEKNKPFLIELSSQRWQKTTHLFFVTDTENEKTDVGDFCS